MSDVRGVGVDLCAVSRMEALLDHATFLRRCFTEKEQAYIHDRGKMAAASMAGIWAAKEAALKAFGVGVTIPMTDVEVVHSDLGQPQYALHGKALLLAEGGSLQLSISHEGDMAAAFCVWSA